MPEWDDSEKTHIQLYENTSLGTPVSPVFKSNEIEKLCEYASENCTTFSDYKATKQEWIEEAQTLTHRCLSLLRPTMRT